MTSFAARIEPAPQPRLAAALFLLHSLAAALPWMAGCQPGLATIATLLALAGLPRTLASVPGSHNGLRRLQVDGRGCQAWTAAAGPGCPARLGPACRVCPGLVGLDLRSDGRKRAWLLPRTALPPAEFRRLKARLRLAC